MSISEPVAGAEDADAAAPGRARLHAGAAPGHVRLLQLRRLLLDHLVLAGCITLVLPRHERRRPGRHHPGLAVRRRCSCCSSPWPWPRSARATRPPAASTTGRPARHAGTSAVWAWFVGWFNFLGQVAVTAAIDFGAAFTSTALLNLSRVRGHRRRTTFLAVRA